MTLPVEGQGVGQRRRCPRERIDASAAVRGAEVRTVADVRELSETGARLVTTSSLAVGMEIRLKLAFAGSIDARIVWAKEGEAGCEFGEQLSPEVYESLCRAFHLPSLER